ncbi:MAG: hypothetical protein JWN39_1325 [Ilumatobacteraceae bacterium]|nr:hypothetical protein [Ilumatobacteraceae bacterium]
MSDFPPPQPPSELPAAPVPDSPAVRSRGPKRWLPAIVGAVLVGVAVGVVVTSGDDRKAHAGEIFTEPADDVGPTPFTPPVVTTNPAAGTTSTSSPPSSSTTSSVMATSTSTGGSSTTVFDPSSTSSSSPLLGSTTFPLATLQLATLPLTSLPLTLPLTTLPLASTPPQTTVAAGGGLGGPVGDGGAQPPVIETVPGNQPGLYGGTRDDKVCNAEQLISYLEATPAKAKAWAGAQGIDVGRIRDYVGQLTPVLLRADTRLTNFGFKDGNATSRQVVLQAGTAVFVDQFGVPRARCKCGNPLAPAKPVDGPAVYTGTQWPGFDPAATQTVTPAPAPIDTLVLTDPNGGTIDRPTGSTGGPDVEVPASSTVPQTTVDSTTVPATTVVPTTAVATTVSETTTVAPTTTIATTLPETTVPATTVPVTTNPVDTLPANTVTGTIGAAPTVLPPVPAGLVNIAGDGAEIASTEYPGGQFPVALAFDGDPTTSWFSAGDSDTVCASDQSTPCSSLLWGLPADAADRLISAVRIVGNQQNADPSVRTGYGFGSVIVRIGDANYTPIFEQRFTLDGDEVGVLSFPNIVGHYVEIIFVGHDSPDCGGVAEVEVLAAP